MAGGGEMIQEFDAELMRQIEDAVSFAIYTAEDTKPVFIKQVVAKAALSVIAPHYEKQISDLKSQIPQWNDDMDALPVGMKALLYCPPRGITNLERVEVDYYDNGNGSIHAWATHWMHIPRPPESPLSPPKTAESEE